MGRDWDIRAFLQPPKMIWYNCWSGARIERHAASLLFREARRQARNRVHLLPISYARYTPMGRAYQTAGSLSTHVQMKTRYPHFSALAQHRGL